MARRLFDSICAYVLFGNVCLGPCNYLARRRVEAFHGTEQLEVGDLSTSITAEHHIAAYDSWVKSIFSLFLVHDDHQVRECTRLPVLVLDRVGTFTSDSAFDLSSQIASSND